jgi:hypothetical protein
LIALSRVPLARLRRSPRAWLPVAAWASLGIVAAASTRLPNGADRTLRGTIAFAVVPLLSYGVVSACLGGKGLRAAIAGMVALGADRRASARATIAVSMLVAASISGVVAALAALLAHGVADAPVARDVPASFGVACLGGATYAAYFCAGSAIRSGAARGVALVLDVVLGSPAGFGAIFVPRGHVTSLFGGPLAFDLSRRASSVFLVVLAALYVAVALRLARRPS